MKKRVSYMFLIVFALCVCFTIGMFVGRSSVGHHIFTSFVPDTDTTTLPHTKASGLIDLNTAPISQLTLLPGIGETLAQRIIDYREERGPFEYIEDIMLVEGIGKVRFEEIAPFITVGG